MIRGTDQIRRKITHGMRNDPPPFCATILENRQIFPVPIAIPIVAMIRAQRDEKNSCCFKSRPHPTPPLRGGLSKDLYELFYSYRF